jgi:thiosulfate/3-mercaptopyruvate sulfurtransferase
MSFTTLVSTEQLAAHAAEWAIVDCRFDLGNENWGREHYAAGHVPGAVYASLNDDLSAPRTGTNGRHPLPSQDALTATMQRLGIDNGMQVVVYDQDSGLYAGRLWWLLRYVGHKNVALLDGGSRSGPPRGARCVPASKRDRARPSGRRSTRVCT